MAPFPVEYSHCPQHGPTRGELFQHPLNQPPPASIQADQNEGIQRLQSDHISISPVAYSSTSTSSQVFVQPVGSPGPVEPTAVCSAQPIQGLMQDE